MPGVAAVSGHLRAIHFPKNSAALGAVIRHLLSETIHCRYIAQHSFGNLCLSPDVFRNRFALAGTCMREYFEQIPHSTDRHTVINLEIIQRALRHAGISGVLRVLDDRKTTALLDGEEAVVAVAKTPRSGHT